MAVTFTKFPDAVKKLELLTKKEFGNLSSSEQDEYIGLLAPVIKAVASQKTWFDAIAKERQQNSQPLPPCYTEIFKKSPTIINDVEIGMLNQYCQKHYGFSIVETVLIAMTVIAQKISEANASGRNRGGAISLDALIQEHPEWFIMGGDMVPCVSMNEKADYILVPEKK